MGANPNEEPHADKPTNDTLADAASTEREYLRTRLRAELGRDPNDEELDEWLREHTEGY
ncbi:MAG: hypothetical protein ACJ74W_22090 [Pyrinomonadaceae bacterium]